MITYFGIRHLSPNGADCMLKLLGRLKPDIVMIEAPSDFENLIPDICNIKTRPPFAIMAYTESVPIQTILYPFAVYSPEYQAIKWAYSHGKTCRFIDLPSGTFLGIDRIQLENPRQISKDKDDDTGSFSVYSEMEKVLGEDSDFYWERTFEQLNSPDTYIKTVEEYGRQLRENDRKTGRFYAENIVRESYMIKRINEAVNDGFENIFVITGAYHTEGLKTGSEMTEQEFKKLPSVDSKTTLMPYSYYRLSERSGYGAGNKAPAYYEMVWNAIRKHKDISQAKFDYLTGIARSQRKHGNMVSSAEVIEAGRLAIQLAEFKNTSVPTLADLRDAVVTCMGHGKFSEVSVAVADTEIGIKIGSLPEGVVRTSLQEDFDFHIKDLKLTRYKVLTRDEISLDIRENLRVKSEKSAFLDLNRSFFLHRLQFLGIHFAQKDYYEQEYATWAEKWSVQWTPECEIEIVEATLKGDTVELAAGFEFKTRLDGSQSVAEVSKLISEACLCGMPETLKYAVSTLQGLAVNCISVAEMAQTAINLSNTLTYGGLRKIDCSALEPLIEQLFIRACLTFADSCVCDAKAVGEIIEAIGIFETLTQRHDFLDKEMWVKVLKEISDRDDLNTKASGYCASILLERGEIDNELLSTEMQRRLSKGIPADLGAEWFEGLAMRNRRSLISRISLWKQLSEYIQELDTDEFKRALVFLRRAFSDFSSQERAEVAENLGEIWGMNAQTTGEILNTPVSETEDIDFGDFDFSDF